MNLFYRPVPICCPPVKSDVLNETKRRSFEEMQANPGRYSCQLVKTLTNAQNDQKLGQNAHTLSTCPLLQLLAEAEIRRNPSQLTSRSVYQRSKALTARLSRNIFIVFFISLGLRRYHLPPPLTSPIHPNMFSTGTT